MEHTRVLQVGKTIRIGFWSDFWWGALMHKWLVQILWWVINGAKVWPVPIPNSALSSGLILFASEGNGDEFAGCLNYALESIKSHAGITAAISCFRQFLDRNWGWVVSPPGTASHCCAAQSCPSAFYCIKGTFLEDGLLHKGDKPSCWEGFWKCLHWEGTRLTSSAVSTVEMGKACILISPKVFTVQRFSSLPVKWELLPNDEEALVEGNRSKVKDWWENSLEKKGAF